MATSLKPKPANAGLRSCAPGPGGGITDILFCGEARSQAPKGTALQSLKGKQDIFAEARENL